MFLHCSEMMSFSWCFFSFFFFPFLLLGDPHYRARAIWTLHYSSLPSPFLVKHLNNSFKNSISCFLFDIFQGFLRGGCICHLCESHKNTRIFTTAFKYIVCMDIWTFFSLKYLPSSNTGVKRCCLLILYRKGNDRDHWRLAALSFTINNLYFSYIVFFIHFKW